MVWWVASGEEMAKVVVGAVDAIDGKATNYMQDVTALFPVTHWSAVVTLHSLLLMCIED
jgi:hypothetical protein